jgi:hypothetical protein
MGEARMWTEWRLLLSIQRVKDIEGMILIQYLLRRKKEGRCKQQKTKR